MTILLSVDPGAHWYGLAYWNNGELEDAYIHLIGKTAWRSYRVDQLVVERPQVYLSNLKAANDMIGVALSAGELVGRCAEVSPVDEMIIRYVRPAEWKGSLKKEIHHPRVLAALREDERDRIDLPKNKARQLDVIDAVGLGLFHLGRTARGGIVHKGVPSCVKNIDRSL